MIALVMRLIYIVSGCWLAYFLYLAIKSLRKRSVTYFQDENGRFRPWGDARYKIREDKYFLIDYYQVFSHFQGYSKVEDGKAWIYLKEDPEEEFCSDNLEMAGYIDLDGNIYDSKSNIIGYVCDEKGERTIDGTRKWYELWLKCHLFVYWSSGDLAGKVIETGRLRKLQKGRFSANARAAAYTLLYGGPSMRNVNEDDLVYDGGWSDTALLASLIYTGVFVMMFLGNLVPLTFPALGEQISFEVVLLLIYWLIWALLRQYKIEKTLVGVDVRHFLFLINRNTGVVGLTKTAILCTVVSLVLTIFVYGSVFLPLQVAILIGLVVNLFSTSSEPWVVSESFPDPVVWDEGEDEEDSSDDDDAPIPDTGEKICYSWDLDSDYHKLKGTMQLLFNPEELAELRAKNPFQNYNGDFISTVRELFALYGNTNKSKIKKIIKYIRESSSKAGLSNLERMQFILDFSQKPNIDYAYDAACDEIGNRQEYVRFPDETLHDKRGDCDCKAALAAALFVEAGYKTVLLTTNNHCAIGVAFPNEIPKELQGLLESEDFIIKKDNLLYFFCETTGDSYRIGQWGSTRLDEIVDILSLN